MKDFETWRQENRRLKEENIEDDMADFMAEVFEIKDRETNILDILNTRVFLKMQTSFLWPGHLDLAVFVYKEAKYQKSDFYLENWPIAAYGIDLGIL